MKLRQISQGNPVTNIVLDEFEKEAPILQDAEFYSKTGSTDLSKRGREPEQPAVNPFRNLNEPETSDPPTRVYDPVVKRIVSFEAQVDKVLEDRNEDVAAELEQETRIEANEVAQTLQGTFFLGDEATNAKSPNGMAALVKPSMVTNGNGGAPLALVLGGDAKRLEQQVVLEFIMNWFRSVRATHAYFPDTFLTRLMLVAKNLGFYQLQVAKDSMGATVENDTVGGVILRSTGRTYSGAAISPFNETLGAANDTASAFACRWGTGTDLTVLTSVGVHAEYEGLRGKFYVNTVDMDMQMHLQKTRSLGRLRGLRLPAAP